MCATQDTCLPSTSQQPSAARGTPALGESEPQKGYREVALESFFTSLSQPRSRNALSAELARVRNATPFPSFSSPLQAVVLWVADSFTRASSLTQGINGALSTFAYKRVANKTRPVATTLPEDFRITRLEHPNPLANIIPLPTCPP